MVEQSDQTQRIICQPATCNGLTIVRQLRKKGRNEVSIVHDVNGKRYVMHMFHVPDKLDEKRALLQAIKNKYDIMKKLTRDGNLNVP